MANIKFNEGDFVINKNQIIDITSLINGGFTLNFSGSVGMISTVNGVLDGNTNYTVKYGDEEKTEYHSQLILVRAEVE